MLRSLRTCSVTVKMHLHVCSIRTPNNDGHPLPQGFSYGFTRRNSRRLELRPNSPPFVSFLFFVHFSVLNQMSVYSSKEALSAKLITKTFQQNKLLLSLRAPQLKFLFQHSDALLTNLYFFSLPRSTHFPPTSSNDP
jgi:hypothetical protein